MVKVPDDPSILAAPNMTPPAKEISDSFEIYMTMSKSFEMEFIRIDKGSDSIVRSGQIPFPCCTCWIEDIFPAVTVQTANVSCEMEISSIHRRPMVLEELAQPSCPFDGVWCWRQ